MSQHRGEVCCQNCGAKLDVRLTISGAEKATTRETPKRADPIGPPVPDDLKAILESTRHFQSLAHDRYGAWWDATIKAFDPYPFFYFDEEIRKADAWCLANGQRKPKSNFQRFLTTWFNRSIEKGRIEQGRIEAAQRRSR